MRLLFLSPNQCRLVFLPLPLGWASVVAAVGPEHEVRVLDFMFLDDPLARLDRVMEEFRPELVASRSETSTTRTASTRKPISPR